MQVFWARQRDGLPENLVFHGLAAKQALQLPDPLLEIADLRGADDVLVSLDGGLTAFEHPPFPREQLRARDPRAAGHERHAHPRLHRLFDEADLFCRRPPL